MYEELRRWPGSDSQRAREHTLQATALVHEAYLKLLGGSPLPWQHRAHFFGACTNAMRQILVEHARAETATSEEAACAEALDEAGACATRKIWT